MISKSADWDKIWSKKFKLYPLVDWESDIFINIYLILKDLESPKILDAGCGRGLIDYWLINVFGFNVVLLDFSLRCIKEVKKFFNKNKVEKSKLNFCHASILNTPYPDNHFDLVWNEGVLEHFPEMDYEKAIKEMVRVSRKYILIDVPYAKSKPYILSKKVLEESNLWPWGYEEPRISLKDDFEKNNVKLIREIPIGSIRTNKNYIEMVPSGKRDVILKELAPSDFKIFPHLMAIGEKI